MTSSAAEASTPRFRFSKRAEPFRLRSGEPHVYGYAWRHPAPTASLVLIHGLQSHSQWFAESADLLVDRGFSVYSVERYGSGASPGPRGDVDRYQRWFDEVADVVRLAQSEHEHVPVHLVGHCFGANLALGCLLTHPIEARSVVMLTPGLYVLPDYSLLEKVQIAASGVLRPQRRFRVPQNDDLFSHDPELLAWIHADSLGAKTVTAHCLLQTNAMLRTLRRRAGELPVPVFVLEASRDRISDNARNRALLHRTFGERVTFVTFDAEHFLLGEPVRDNVLATLTEWVTSTGTA